MNTGLGKVTFDSIGNIYFQVCWVPFFCRSHFKIERRKGGNSPSAATPCTWARWGKNTPRVLAPCTRRNCPEGSRVSPCPGPGSSERPHCRRHRPPCAPRCCESPLLWAEHKSLLWAPRPARLNYSNYTFVNVTTENILDIHLFYFIFILLWC